MQGDLNVVMVGLSFLVNLLLRKLQASQNSFGNFILLWWEMVTLSMGRAGRLPHYYEMFSWRFFADLLQTHLVCAIRSISILNNPCKYQISFSDERVLCSGYLAQLLSPNFMFQYNLFSQKQI